MSLFYFEDSGSLSCCGQAKTEVFEDADTDTFSDWSRPSHVTVLVISGAISHTTIETRERMERKLLYVGPDWP